MTKTEFIDRWIGTPWKDRAIGPNSIDCWGLVYVYYRDVLGIDCLLYTSPSPRDRQKSRMPSSA